MKRFACHFLYDSLKGCCAKQIVELTESGRVSSHFPLEEELSATQWIGGVIVLSPLSELEIHPGESFADFLNRVIVEDGNLPVYVWHIADFNLAEREFTVNSKAIRL